MRARRLVRLLGIITVTATLGLGFAVDSGAAVATVPAGHAGTGVRSVASFAPADSYGYNMKFRHSGKCIEVSGAVKTNIQLDQYTCVNQTNEYWHFDPVNSDGTVFRIRSGSSGKCMNVQGASGANSAKIIQYPCGAYTNEYWEAVQDSAGYDLFISYAHTSKCLNIQGASKANHGKLIQYTCEDVGNEQISLY